MSTPDIRITVHSKPALTTAMAAERHGYTPAGMRNLLSARRYNLDPVAMLDPRTPLYDQEAVDQVVANKVGQGKGGGRPKHAPAD
jgi:hypothetical protein